MIVKRLISVLCLVAFTFGVSFSVQAGDNEEERMIKQEHSLDLYEEMMSTFPETYSDDGTQIFPDFYGGAFLDGKSNLVVCLTEDIELSNIPSEAIIKHVTYSMNDLQRLDNYLESIYFDGTTDNYHGIYSFGVRIKENRVEMEVADESAKEFVESCVAKELPELYDALYINVIEIAPSFCSNMNPGDYIGTSSMANNRSIGCFATNSSGKFGLVTAGHNLNVGDKITFEGNIVGTVQKAKTGGTVDVAFVIPSNSWNWSNLILGEPTMHMFAYGHPDRNIPGTVIYKAGASTGFNSGEVVNLHDKFNGLTNVFSTTIKSGSGDSGGLLLKKVKTTGNMVQYEVMGILSGVNTIIKQSFFTRIDEAMNALGFVPYFNETYKVQFSEDGDTEISEME